ncbi:MAG: DUF2752 domain-containing protein [Actinomycetota bacterium]|nr:DUF2752 domain-containing protein [Actinomycetota bacterium]
MVAPTPFGPVEPVYRRVMAARFEIELRPIRYIGAAMLALGVALPHLPGNPGLPCPLRSATGVPCPFCGLTTSVKAVMRGDGHSAWAANPFGLVIVVFAVALVLRPRWRQLTLPLAVVLAGVAASWLFELHRYHFL